MTEATCESRIDNGRADKLDSQRPHSGSGWHFRDKGLKLEGVTSEVEGE